MIVRCLGRGAERPSSRMRRGSGGAQRWVLGSVAERVLHTTKVPLLIVHAVRAKHETHEETHSVAHQSTVGV